jgi:nitrogen regulatory protein P-II 1
MIRIVAYLKPHKLEAAKSAVAILGISGLTVGDARGRGNSEERTRYLDGEEHIVALPMRSRLEVVVPEELQEPVVEAILSSVRTGEPGDGKILISKVEEAIRVRTGERGEAGL